MKRIVIALSIFSCAFLSTSVYSAEKAATLVEQKKDPVVQLLDLEQKLAIDDSLAPDISSFDERVDRLLKQSMLLSATLDRNKNLEALRVLYQKTGVSEQPIVGSNDSISMRGASSTGFDSFFGPQRGSDSGSIQGSSDSADQPPLRLAALKSYFSFGKNKTAVVRWDPITPTVEIGEYLPGGFLVKDIHPSDIVMEKDGITFLLTNEPVNIDDLLDVIADKRKEEK